MQETFSERHELEPRKALQLSRVDNALRNRLWNGLTLFCWRYLERRQIPEQIDTLVKRLWIHNLNWPLDEFHYATALNRIREHFYGCAWNQVYDLLEFVIREYPERDVEDLVSYINQALQRELATRLYDEGIRRAGSGANPGASARSR